jgi:hypothetical protein
MKVIYKEKRYYTIEIRDQFKLTLKDEQWEYVYRADETSTSYQIFLGLLDYYFNIAFPLKRGVIKNNSNNTWISKGILKSRNRMLFLHSLRKTKALTSKSLTYIKN